MRLMSNNLGLGQGVTVGAIEHQGWHVDFENPGHFTIKQITLRTWRHALGLFVKTVKFRMLETGIVSDIDILAIEQLHKVVSIRIVGNPCRTLEHGFTLLFQLDTFSKWHGLTGQLNMDTVQGLFPEFTLLLAPTGIVNNHFNYQRFTFRRLPPAICTDLVV